jgi:DNA (cytosine-5)-methyltransferase 1
VTAVYQEIADFPCRWLGNLKSAGHIAPGTIIPGDIRNVRPEDVEHATQAHFFAGIGVWSHALRLAGWPDGTPVWTGSCPCQPFSTAGRRKGTADERHLWPEWYRLIKACRPPVVFGEQVASPAGRAWLDTVRAEMEALGYAFGAADLCAAGIGAPHRRQRLWFVAFSRDYRREIRSTARVHEKGQRGDDTAGRCADGGQLGDTAGRVGRQVADLTPRDSHEEAQEREKQVQRDVGEPVSGFVGDPHGDPTGQHARELPRDEGSVRGFWEAAEWIPCRDGKARPVEPGTFPLVDGSPARVGRLRAYGNAIVPQVAAAFIQGAIEAINGGES